MAAPMLKSALLALLASVALTNAAAATTTAEATETDPTANEDPCMQYCTGTCDEIQYADEQSSIVNSTALWPM
jgi:hypothetical protein